MYGIIYKDSRKVYEGEFQNDKFNGAGKLYNLDDNNNYLFYEGNFENGEISGKGIKYYINGKKSKDNLQIFFYLKGNIMIFIKIYYLKVKLLLKLFFQKKLYFITIKVKIYIMIKPLTIIIIISVKKREL